MTTTDKLRGLLLGTAVGDALGLPMEGLSPKQIHDFGWINRNQPLPCQHRLIFGRGMMSDDTEHTLFAAQCLARFPNHVHKFRACLAWQFRWWFLSLPPGIGLATARAILKLLIGFPPTSSGVYSAGNGPAMRAAIIGAACYRNLEQLVATIAASTRITHTDSRALTGATAVALAAAYAMRNVTEVPSVQRNVELLHHWRQLDPEDAEWQKLLTQMAVGLEQNLTVAKFAHSLGLTQGVSGYIYHTVPVALYAWLHHYGDFIASITSVLELGGDTDTVGAITGALAGMVIGERGIPPAWINGIVDWPRSPTLLRRVADVLAKVVDGQIKNLTWEVAYFYPAVLIRNLLFLGIVLVHGICRYLPI